MKVSVYKLVLLGIILSYCPILSAQDIIYVYRNDGKFNAFYSNEIDSMVCSHVGPDSASFHKNDYLVQEIYTADSIYRIPIAAIDSISSVVPEPILNDKVFPLTQEISPYVLSADTLTFILSLSTPTKLMPSVGNVVVSSYDCIAFPHGIIAKVEQISKVENGFLYECSPASIDDIYDQIVYFGELGVETNEVINNSAKRRVTGTITRTLWNESFEKQWQFSGTTTRISGRDEAHITLTISKTLTTPLYVNLELTNTANASFSFNAKSESSISPDRFKIGPTLRCGRICIPEFPLIWFEPQLSLYGYVREEGEVSLDFSANYNRTDKFSLVYSNHSWQYYYAPLTTAGIDVASVSMTGFGEIGIQPEFMISLNGFPTGIGISSSFGLRESIQFKFDALEYLNTGIYDAIKDTKATLSSPQSVSLFAQAGLFEKNARRGTFPLWSRQPTIGSPKYLLPAFSDLQQFDGQKRGCAVMVTKPSRDLLLPVDIGLMMTEELLDKEVERNYSSVRYSGSSQWPLSSLTYEFKGLNPLKKYVCYPMVKICGIEFRATPTKDVDFEVEVITGDVEDISSTSATVYGQIKGIDSSMDCAYGICYRSSKEDEWIYKYCMTDHNEFNFKLTGLTKNERYYYRTFLLMDGELSYGDTKSFKACDLLHLNVDVVMCIDCTGSMGGAISTVQQNAMSFYDSFSAACEQKDVDLVSLTAQVIGFRDLKIGEPMQTSATYSLPSQRAGFNSFVSGLRADGGGDTPESALEALSSAFSKLDWSGNDENYRQVVILWTDAPYLTTMSVSSLLSRWNGMPEGKRLILFAPSGTGGDSNAGSWSAFDGWPNTIRHTNLSVAFTDFEYILDVVSGELNKARRKAMLMQDQEKTEFAPN